MNRKRQMFNSAKAMRDEKRLREKERAERDEAALESALDKQHQRAFTPTTSSSTLVWAGALILLLGVVLSAATQGSAPFLFALPLAILSWIGSAIAKPLDRILYHMIEERDTRD